MTSRRRPGGWVVMMGVCLPLPLLLLLFPQSSSAQANNGTKTCTVTQGYRVVGFGGARCCLKFPCSTRLAKFTIQAFLHSHHIGCVVNVFAAAAYRRKPLPLRLPGQLRPRTVWVHLKLLHLDPREILHLDLLTSDPARNVTAFEFVLPTNLAIDESGNGSIQTRMFVWRGVEVVSSFSTDVTSAVVSLPQFDVIVRFRPIPLDLLAQNSTLLDEPAVVIEAPSQARSVNSAFSAGGHCSYSVCGCLRDDASLWRRARNRGLAESQTQACIRFAVTSYGQPLPPRPPALDEGECLKPSVSLKYCERRDRALRSCAPLLLRPLLLRCLYNRLTQRHHLTPTSSNLTKASSGNSTDSADEFLTFPYRLFRTCLRFVCTGNTTFCHLLGWQRGNGTEPHGNTTQGNSTGGSLQGDASSTLEEEGITWNCKHLFHELLQESLRRGCEDCHWGLDVTQ